MLVAAVLTVYAFIFMFQDFESKIVNAAKAGKRTELIYLQKLFESEILLAILKSLNNTVTDLDSVSENLVVQTENVENTSKIREKRSLGLLSSLLGSSSAAKTGGGGGAGADAVSILPNYLFSVSTSTKESDMVLLFVPNKSLAEL